MTLTPEEVDMARSMLSSIQNTTVQGFDIFVRGTSISHAIYLFDSMICLLMSFCASQIIWNMYKDDRKDERVIKTIGIFLAVLSFSGLFFWIVGDYLVGMFAPEYIVINKIINGVT